jgi:2-polyprenyl-3-methyl-5-hydroxy-6-metoxy-1,4-benzoquinol methylase
MEIYQKHRLEKIAALSQGPAILDIGCAAIPNPYLQGTRVVGLDLQEMKVLPPYTEHVISDVTEAEAVLGSEVFDSIIMGEFIEHMERPYDILRSIRTLLKPQGVLLLSTPNPLGLPVVVAEYLTMRRFFYEKEHTFYFTPRWVWRLLERCGFEVTGTIGCGLYLKPFWFPAPSTLSYQVIYVARHKRT